MNLSVPCSPCGPAGRGGAGGSGSGPGPGLTAAAHRAERGRERGGGESLLQAGCFKSEGGRLRYSPTLSQSRLSSGPSALNAPPVNPTCCRGPGDKGGSERVRVSSAPGPAFCSAGAPASAPLPAGAPQPGVETAGWGGWRCHFHAAHGSRSPGWAALACFGGGRGASPDPRPGSPAGPGGLPAPSPWPSRDLMLRFTAWKRLRVGKERRDGPFTRDGTGRDGPGCPSPGRGGLCAGAGQTQLLPDPRGHRWGDSGFYPPRCPPLAPAPGHLGCPQRRV